MRKNQKLKIINKVNNNTLMEHLDIEFIDVGNDYLTAKMPVSSKVHQPDGVLHGGATVALAESVGSAASFLFINPLNQTIRDLRTEFNKKGRDNPYLLDEDLIEDKYYAFRGAE